MRALAGHPADQAHIQWAAAKMGTWWTIDARYPAGTLRFVNVQPAPAERWTEVRDRRHRRQRALARYGIQVPAVTAQP